MVETLFTKLTAAARTAQSNSSGAVLTQEFLGTCRLVLPVIDQMGAGLAIVKSDIQGNIDRLATKAASDPARFGEVWAIVEHDVEQGEAGGSRSSTKGLLWLKRGMEFMAATFSRLADGEPMSAAVSAAYDATLKPFHGYLAYGTFKVALTFVPSRETFLAGVGGGAPGEELRAQMLDFGCAFDPVLAELQRRFVEAGLDDPATV